MKPSATSDFSPPDSSESRFGTLPAGVTSISTPGGRVRPAPPSGSALAARPPARPRRRRPRFAATQHHARLRRVDAAQATAATGEQLLDHFFEVARRGLEGLVEGLADAAVGVADQAL